MISKERLTLGILTGLLLSVAAYATGSTVGYFDQIRGKTTLTIKNGPRTLSMDTGTDTNTTTAEILDESNVITVTNKSMSGASNTFTNIPAATAITGQLPVANGGTALAALGSANYLFGTNAAANAFEHKAVTVTAAGAMAIPKYLALNRRDENGTASVTALDSSQSYVKLTSGGTPVTTINTIAAGVDGQQIVIYNATGSAVTIKDSSAGLGSANDRIKTSDGGDMTLSNLTPAAFRYDSGQSKWVVDGGGAGGAVDLSLASGVLDLAHGGTEKNLTASNGAVCYSDADSLELLAAGSTGQMLRMGAAIPAWTTATYPATTTINRILYSSANDVIGQITTGNRGALVTDNSGVPSITASSADGEVLRRSGGSIAFGAVDFADSDAVTGNIRSANLNIVTDSRAAPGAITAGGGITATAAVGLQTQFINGSGGAVTVTANPQISAGTVVGQRMILIGRSDTNTVTFSNGTGLSLNGPAVLGADDVLTLLWDGTNWLETGRTF